MNKPRKGRIPRGKGEPTVLQGHKGTVEALGSQAGAFNVEKGRGGGLPFGSEREEDALILLLSEPPVESVEPASGSWLNALGLKGWNRSTNVGYKVVLKTHVSVLVLVLEDSELSRNKFDGVRTLRERGDELGYAAVEIWIAADIKETLESSLIRIVRRDLFHAEHRPDDRAQAVALQKLKAAGGRAKLAQCSLDFRLAIYSAIINGKARFVPGCTPPWSEVELVGDESASAPVAPKFDLREEESNPDVISAITEKTPFVRAVGNTRTLIRLKSAKKPKTPSAALPPRSAQMKARRMLAIEVLETTPKSGAGGFYRCVQQAIAEFEKSLLDEGILDYPLPRKPPGIRTLKRWRGEFRKRGTAAYTPGYNRKSREGVAWSSEAGQRLERALRQHMEDAACR